MGAQGLRALPPVDQVLAAPELAAALSEHGRSAALHAVRTALAEVRARLLEGHAADVDRAAIALRAVSILTEEARPSLRPVLNLTGTVIHTNLGRAILAEAAVQAALTAMREAVNLEFDLDEGRRGERDVHVRDLLVELTGAEDATVVNNNAAAVVLVINTLALGKDAIVSRGELIEIGGAFRMPDIMERAGARLVEVGTTNRTHLRDYTDRIGPGTGMILKVHTSNYRIEGFTSEVTAAELAGPARKAGIPLVNDLGSGTLAELTAFGLPHEPTVREAVEEGADLVTFSGDKLLGGPQAGFVVGRRDLIARINRNPLKRALRVDKIRLAALEATLRLYRDPDRLAETVPTLRRLARREPEIRAQAQRLVSRAADLLGPAVRVEVTACESQIGSGALPTRTLKSAGLRLVPAGGSGRALAELSTRLRGLPRPVIGRIEEGALVLDLRGLERDEDLLDALGPFSQEGTSP